MKFRERDGVCVTYDVSGQSDDGEFPYVNDLPTLKEAVAIAKTYPGIYGDGSATHITRRFAKLYPLGSKFHHHAGRTHRWRVSSEGKLMLEVAYSSHGNENPHLSQSQNIQSNCKDNLVLGGNACYPSSLRQHDSK